LLLLKWYIIFIFLVYINKEIHYLFREYSKSNFLSCVLKTIKWYNRLSRNYNIFETLILWIDQSTVHHSVSLQWFNKNNEFYDSYFQVYWHTESER